MTNAAWVNKRESGLENNWQKVLDELGKERALGSFLLDNRIENRDGFAWKQEEIVVSNRILRTLMGT